MIAQTVKEVLPEAISLSICPIPSIFKLATSAILSDDEKYITIIVDIPETSELKVEGTVLLIIEEFKDEQRVNVISMTSTQLVVPAWANFNNTHKVFVYGAVINDFHVVDKPYLGVLCMGGIQELTKRSDELTNKVATLQTNNDELSNKVSTMQETITTLQINNDELTNKIAIQQEQITLLMEQMASLLQK
jgi:outer membrane murein-binding lipoprotein Lpp